MDVHSKEVRSYNMSHVKGVNTKPEEKVRKYLFSKGFRYRINVSSIPGTPDIVLPKYKIVIFVNGCFWHMHNDCSHFSWPRTNEEFWKSKLSENKRRDERNYMALSELGWHIVIIWECELKKKVFPNTMECVMSEIRTNFSAPVK